MISNIEPTYIEKKLSSIPELRLTNFCGLALVNMSRDNFAKNIVSQLENGCRRFVCFSLNGQSFSLYHKSLSFKNLIDQADLIHADGMSIVKASKYIASEKLVERIATTDWFHDVANYTEGKNISHFFIGSTKEGIEKTILNVKKLYPKLLIKGYHHGYFKDINHIVRLVNKSKPDILWLGLGRPKQEHVALILKREAEVGMIKTCGGLFDFLSGKNQRAPLWMHLVGLEWIYRTLLEPRRLFVRYLVTNIHSIYLFLSFFLKKDLKPKTNAKTNSAANNT